MIKFGGKKKYLGTGAIILLLIFLNYLGALNWFKSQIRSLFLPFFAETNNLSVNLGDNYEFFKDKETFFMAYRECKEANTQESVDAARLKVLEEENALLKKNLSFKEKLQTKIVIARVVGKNIEKTDQTIIIDKGAEEGVKEGLPVIVGDGVLVGKVIKSEAGFSIVRLINDNQSKTAATVLNTERSLGVVEGGYGLSVRMNFIPRNEVVRVGDQITTSGLDENMPRGLLIGTVTAVENETYRPFQEAVLAPTADLNKLFLVSVLVLS